MLPPVTKQYDDSSTDQWFRFVFFCDRCGAGWESEQYPFSMRDAPSHSEGDEKARALLWRTEHDAAYERANTEALFHFNKCPLCGKRICDDCFSAVDDVCVSCSGSKAKGGRSSRGKL